MKPAVPEHRELMKICIDICQIKPQDDHFHAVQLVCSSALELFRGVVKLCEDENAIPAKALSRVLLETLVTSVVLAKHPEKLQDFKDCSRYLHLRSLQSHDSDILPEMNSRRAAIIAKHGADYNVLDKKFGKRPWHGMTRRAALIAAGFDFNVYDGFYSPTSAFIHGDPSRYTMMDLNEWIFGRSDRKEALFLVGGLCVQLAIFPRWHGANQRSIRPQVWREAKFIRAKNI